MCLSTAFFARCSQGLLCVWLSFPAYSQIQDEFSLNNFTAYRPTAVPNNTPNSSNAGTPNPVSVNDMARTAAVETTPPATVATNPTPFAFTPLAPTDFLFVPGTTTLQAGEEERIANYGQRLKENRNIRINLIGHTSYLGSRAYSLAVAELRVSMIKKALMQNGARAQQIRVYPIGNEGDGQHSRVELQVLP